MKNFYLLLISVFILSIFSTTPLYSIVENSENLNEKILEEKNFEEDTDKKFMDKSSSHTITCKLRGETPHSIQTIKISSYSDTHFRPPILL